jgi:dolichol-phosphate mannosyltransferase
MASTADSGILASIIVPAYREAGNIKELVERVFAAIKQSKKFNLKNTEMIFVDDNSRDGTEEGVRQLASSGFPVRIIVRTTERGLSSAVIRGFQEARGLLLLCMDADLQVCVVESFQRLSTSSPFHASIRPKRCPSCWSDSERAITSL